MNIPHQLETERLILRRLVPLDIEPFSAFMRDDEATRYMVFTTEQRTHDGAKEMIDYTISAYDTKEAVFVLAIADKEGKYLGSLGATPTENPTEIEFFYTLLPNYWGKGFATEATQQLLHYLFNNTDAEVLVAYVFPENSSSIGVLDRLGLTKIGEVTREGHTGLKYQITRTDYQKHSLG